MKTKKITFILCLTLFLAPSVYADNQENELEDLSSTLQNIAEVSAEISDDLAINSRAAVVIDRNTQKILYGKCENEQRKMASTTKIMTATIVIENANLYDTVTISKKAAGTGGSSLGLKAGDKISVCDLLYGLLLKSGNDSAVALAEHVGGNVEGFAEMMNSKAKELNLAHTNFVTPHGLDSDNHYTTAYELALLANYAMKNETFSNIVATKNYTVTINGYPKTISNTNELLGNLNGVYGIKTGFTNGANRCLVTACKRDDLDIICVVLGADTKKFRTQDSVKLIEYCFNTYTCINLKNLAINKFNNWKDNYTNSVSIIKGSNTIDDMKLANWPNEHYPIKKNEKDNIHFSFSASDTLIAPIEENSTIASLNIQINENEVLNYNIVNTNKIYKKDIKNYLHELIANYENYLCKTIDNLL